MKVAIFCSANNNLPDKYFRCAEELAAWLVRGGNDIVFGGTQAGLMGCIADTVKSLRKKDAVAGRLIGVVPRIVEEGGRSVSDMDVEIPCENLSDRKDIMINHSDICIALPGGIGTLDEIFTVASAASIGYHHKQVIMYNIDGFWNSFTAMLDDLSLKGVIRGPWQQHFIVCDTFEEVQNTLNQINI